MLDTGSRMLDLLALNYRLVCPLSVRTTAYDGRISASIHRPNCSRESVVTAEVPFDLGECGLLKLATPGSKGHLWDAIVAHRDQDTRDVR